LLLLILLKWIIAIASVFFILAAWGADTTMMLASAGVLTLIIGLGSQALVQDILAGIFIVFEGDFQVGDIVIIDGWRGEVKAIGIRTTKLVDAGGNIKIVNNSDIRSIINQTKELSVAKCFVGISYGDRIEKVEKIIADNLPAIKEKIPGMVEGPFYKGVSELAESSVNLLFVAKCKENDVYQVQRDLNREIKIVFDDNNVNIPFPQVTVSYDEGSDKTKVSKVVKNEAEEFVEEQKDLSKDIEIKK
jgi:small conductance mechanosensitive channel